MRSIAVCLALCAGPAAAQTELPDLATGAAYVLTVTAEDSATLAGTDAIDTFTLRADCFATHEIYGIGLWKVTEGGWSIEMGGAPIVSFTGAPPLDASCPPPG
ncbi:hypothetical protein [Xinfangfangia pollutisoli]|uniref:hypothetical protein n=1 Tax=Xinfangfangia pollutisoli TaxID=2865960 RepID=UPI001CD71254|nr:hypothetical protein [Xinfangfangia pollutisoli]